MKKNLQNKNATRLFAGALAAALVLGSFPPVVARADDDDDYEFHDYDFVNDDDNGYDDWEPDDQEEIYVEEKPSGSGGGSSGSGSSGSGYEAPYGYLATTVHDSNIQKGETTLAEASVVSNASSASLEVRWSSSNDGVASVSGYGEHASVTGRGSGSATITASLYVEGKKTDSDSFTIKVYKPTPAYTSVTGISIERTSVDLKVGDSTTVDAWVQPSNANDKVVTFKSNNSSVATVNNDGKIQAKAAGSTTITAVTRENGYKAYVNVTVRNETRNVAVSAISLTPTSATVGIGQTVNIGVHFSPSDASNQTVTWSSSNPSAANVASNGVVTGVAAGSAVITARSNDGGKSATMMVTVSPAATAPVTAVSSRDAAFTMDLINRIATAPANGTVSVPATKPLSFDANVAAALNIRKDVTVIVTFPFQGHTFSMAVPAGRDLTPFLDKNGFVEWLTLCTRQDVFPVAMLN